MGKPKKKYIIVKNKNDPRYKAYQDSTRLYNRSQDAIKNQKALDKISDDFLNSKEMTEYIRLINVQKLIKKGAGFITSGNTSRGIVEKPSIYPIRQDSKNPFMYRVEPDLIDKMKEKDKSIAYHIDVIQPLMNKMKESRSKFDNKTRVISLHSSDLHDWDKDIDYEKGIRKGGIKLPPPSDTDRSGISAVRKENIQPIRYDILWGNSDGNTYVPVYKKPVVEVLTEDTKKGKRVSRQLQLKKADYYDGEIDGEFGTKSRTAEESYSQHTAKNTNIVEQTTSTPKPVTIPNDARIEKGWGKYWKSTSGTYAPVGGGAYYLTFDKDGKSKLFTPSEFKKLNIPTKAYGGEINNNTNIDMKKNKKAYTTFKKNGKVYKVPNADFGASAIIALALAAVSAAVGTTSAVKTDRAVADADREQDRVQDLGYREATNKQQYLINKDFKENTLNNTGGLYKAMGGSVNNALSPNSVQLDPNAEMLTNNSGGVSGSHESGQNVPIQNENGDIVAAGEPGEIISDQEGLPATVLSKKLGFASTYMSLDSAKDTLHGLYMKSNNPTVRKAINKALGDIKLTEKALTATQSNVANVIGAGGEQEQQGAPQLAYGGGFEGSNTTDYISAGSSLLSNITNLALSSNLPKVPKRRPIPPTYIDTKYNISDELGSIDKSVSESRDFASRTITNPNVRNAIANRSLNKSIEAKGKLYGLKEQKERQLRNFSSVTNAAITEKNLDNDFNRGLLSTQRSGQQITNASGITASLNSQLQQILRNRDLNELEKKKMLAVLIGDIYGTAGRGFDDKNINEIISKYFSKSKSKSE